MDVLVIVKAKLKKNILTSDTLYVRTKGMKKNLLSDTKKKQLERDFDL